jgi:hypothetical protein
MARHIPSKKKKTWLDICHGKKNRTATCWTQKQTHNTSCVDFHFANCGFQFKQQNRIRQPKYSMSHINSLLLESFLYQSLSSSIQSSTLRNQDMVTLSIDNTT